MVRGVGLRRVSVIDREGLILDYENKKRKEKTEPLGVFFLAWLMRRLRRVGTDAGLLVTGALLRILLILARGSDGQVAMGVQTEPLITFPSAAFACGWLRMRSRSSESEVLFDERSEELGGLNRGVLLGFT